MRTEPTNYTCDRCGAAFPITETHTEVVRRDFVGVPRPSRIERFCRSCWQEYVEGFLDRDFDAVLDSYDAEGHADPEEHADAERYADGG